MLVAQKPLPNSSQQTNGVSPSKRKNEEDENGYKQKMNKPKLTEVMGRNNDYIPKPSPPPTVDEVVLKPRFSIGRGISRR